jgi:hypothetical protein
VLLAIVICFVPIVEHKACGYRILRVVLEVHLLLGRIVHLQLVLVTVTTPNTFPTSNRKLAIGDERSRDCRIVERRRMK